MLSGGLRRSPSSHAFCTTCGLPGPELAACPSCRRFHQLMHMCSRCGTHAQPGRVELLVCGSCPTALHDPHRALCVECHARLTLCAGCGVQVTSLLKTCGKCRQVRYCSTDCQLSHWPVHAPDCALPTIFEESVTIPHQVIAQRFARAAQATREAAAADDGIQRVLSFRDGDVAVL